MLYLRLCLSYPLTITPVITFVSSEEIKGIFQSQNIKLDHISKPPLQCKQMSSWVLGTRT